MPDATTPLVIYRSVNREGATFALDPASERALRKALGSAVHVRSRVFVAHETQADYEAFHGDIAPQVVQLLTGVTAQRLRRLGGVVFRDASTEVELHRAS